MQRACSIVPWLQRASITPSQGWIFRWFDKSRSPTVQENAWFDKLFGRAFACRREGGKGVSNCLPTTPTSSTCHPNCPFLAHFEKGAAKGQPGQVSGGSKGGIMGLSWGVSG
eukprot:592818-Pelagomonas_calceolata.AAC.1